MAYPSSAVFQGIPALFAPQLPRQRQQRRTATGIMAGRFDPLPALVSDSGRDDPSSSPSSIITAPEHQLPAQQQDIQPPGPVLARPARRKSAAPRKSLPPIKDRKSVPAIKRPSASRGPAAFASKGKHVRRVLVPEDKENAMDDDTDSATSLSPLPPSLPPASKTYPAARNRPAATTATTTTTKPKASGFWRARSTNTPEGSSAPAAAAAATVVTNKRKHSSLFDDSSSSPLASAQRFAKKPRLAAAIAAAAADPHTATAAPFLSPSSESLTSLDPESGEAPPPKKTTIEFAKKASSARKQIQKLHFKKRRMKKYARASELPRINGHQKTPEWGARHASHPPRIEQEPADQLLPPHIDPSYQTIDSQPLPGDANYFPLPVVEKKRAKRKNTAPRKGWKGWVEEELDPQKLILLDKPEVLPERTTRSGRKID